jgi:hypothetical protein
MNENKHVLSKWLIKGIEGYCFGSDLEVYRMPFNSGRNNFGLRKLIKQHPNRWRINGVWWSQRQLKSKIYLNPEPEIIIDNEEKPFLTK